MVIHVICKTHDYDKAKQDGRVRKTNCVSNNNRTHASMNHTVTLITVAPRIFLLKYLYTVYLRECFHI